MRASRSVHDHKYIGGPLCPVPVYLGRDGDLLGISLDEVDGADDGELGRRLLSIYMTQWCPSDMYIQLHLCRVLEASGSILVDIERYGICCIRS